MYVSIVSSVALEYQASQLGETHEFSVSLPVLFTIVHLSDATLNWRNTCLIQHLADAVLDWRDTWLTGHLTDATVDWRNTWLAQNLTDATHYWYNTWLTQHLTDTTLDWCNKNKWLMQHLTDATLWPISCLLRVLAVLERNKFIFWVNTLNDVSFASFNCQLSALRS